MIQNWRDSATLAFKAEGEVVLLAGAPAGCGTHLGQSLYLREILGREDGAPPPVNLGHERRVGEFVRRAVNERRVTAVHDLSDGGLAVAIAEMAMAAGIGAGLDAIVGGDAAALFGEDQGRYVLTTTEQTVEALLGYAEAAAVPLQVIGRTGGTTLQFGGSPAMSIARLREVHEGWFPRYMGS